MKTFNKIALFCLAGLALIGCDKHDPLDADVFVGKVAPTVYWSVKSTSITAGDSVPFTAQYYTTGDAEINYLEVWYDVVETETKEVSAPMFSNIALAISSNTEKQLRIPGPSCRFYHSDLLNRPGIRETQGVDSMGQISYFKETYKFSDKFPTSNTLSVLSFGNANFDSLLVDKYFGQGFMQMFKDSIEIMLKGRPGFGKEDTIINGRVYKYDKELANKNIDEYGVVWSSMLGEDGKVFNALKDSIVDQKASEQAGYTIYTYFFKDSVLPDILDSAFLRLQFTELISNNNAEKQISYKKSYKLNAQMKCYDSNGIEGLSLKSVIDLN